jgi:hypothetical protein
MLRTERLLLAAYGVWVALVLVTLVGEMFGVLSSTWVVNNAWWTNAPLASESNPFDQFDPVLPTLNWARLIFAMLAPLFIGAVLVALLRWAANSGSPPAARDGLKNPPQTPWRME